MSSTAASSLFVRVVSAVQVLAEESERALRPMEVDPYRGQLFELFVTAYSSGYVENPEPGVDLSSDGLCRELSERWGLKEAAAASPAGSLQLPAGQMSKMRVLWSVMRLWMEWSYAWSRWDEFHRPAGTADMAHE